MSASGATRGYVQNGICCCWNIYYTNVYGMLRVDTEKTKWISFTKQIVTGICMYVCMYVCIYNNNQIRLVVTFNNTNNSETKKQDFISERKNAFDS